jgi:hypothetical protein
MRSLRLPNIRFKDFLFAYFLFGSNLIFADELPSYIIKKNECLSDILFRMNIGPIYGKSGALIKLLRNNPHLGDGRRIYPSQSISFKNLSPYQTVPEISVDPAISETLGPYPASEVKVEKSKTDNQKSRSDFSLALSDRFLKIESKDFKSGEDAILLSDAGAGYIFSWGQNWSENVATFLSFEQYNVHILNSANPARILENANQKLSNYTFGLSHLVGPEAKFYFLFNYGESIVFRASDPTTIVIDKFVTPKLNPGIDYTIFSRDELKFHSYLNLILALPSKQEIYSSKLSYGYRFGLELEDVISIFKLRGGLFYNSLDLKMSETSFYQQELGMLLGLSTEFGSK